MKRVLSLTIFLLFSSISCGKTAPMQQKKQIFSSNFPFDPPTLDPRKGSDVVASTVHFMLYEGLTRMTPISTHEPGVAEKIDISEDHLVYTFHLRDSLWSDGSLVTAEDFAYAWKTILDPSFPSPNANLLYPIKNSEAVKQGKLPPDTLGIRVIDDKTFEVTLERPTPYFLDLTSFCVFFPVPKKVASLHPNWAEKEGPYLVTNGPFKLTSWKRGNHLSFSQNPLFWEKEKVSLQQIEINILNDELTSMQMFEKGEIDYMGGFFTNVPPDMIPQLRERGILFKHPVGATSFIAFNLDRFPFHNKHIRKAITYAINRRDIVKEITQADERIATGCVPPLLKKDKEISFYTDGDSKRAIEEFELGLTELGIDRSAFDRLSILYASDAKLKNIIAAIQEQLHKTLGIRLKIHETGFQPFLGNLTSRDFDLALTMWVIQYNDQMNILDRFKLRSNVKNYPGFEDPKYIHLLEDSAYATDDSLRLQLLEEAETLIVEEFPFAPLFHWNLLYLKQPRVDGLFISPVGSHHFNDVKIVDIE